MNPVEMPPVVAPPVPASVPTISPALPMLELINSVQQITEDHKHHKRAMFEVILQTKAQRVLETGTDVGDSARIFATALRMTGGSLITVDIRDLDNAWGVAFPNIKFVKGNASEIQSNQPLDVVYIDDHFEGMDVKNHVLKELNTLGKQVRKGGWILIDDSLHDKFGAGITQAVREWCKENQLVWYEDCQGNGMVFIEVTNDFHVLKPA